ncbi:MAG: hypothetical protein ACK55I_19275 [bacterium]
MMPGTRPFRTRGANGHDGVHQSPPEGEQQEQRQEGRDHPRSERRDDRSTDPK